MANGRLSQDEHRVRPAREDDVPRLVEIAKRSWLSAFSATAPAELVDYWRRLRREESLYPREWSTMLVLEESGRIVGVVQPKESEINGLWVDPDDQGHGAGT